MAPMSLAVACGAAALLASAPGTQAAAITADEKKDILDRHNLFRCIHGVPLFEWDDAVQKEAQAWADTMAAAKSMYHSEDKDRTHNDVLWGENLAYKSGGTYKGSEATQDWYDEINLTDNKAGLVSKFVASLAHYTALVWDQPTKLGCGKAINGGNTYWACQMNPVGNTAGLFDKKVRKPWHTVGECADPANPTGTPAPAPTPVCDSAADDKAKDCEDALGNPKGTKEEQCKWVSDYIACNPGPCCTKKVTDFVAMVASPNKCPTPTCPTPAPTPTPTPTPSGEQAIMAGDAPARDFGVTAIVAAAVLAGLVHP